LVDTPVNDAVEVQFTTSRAELTRALRAINRGIPHVQWMWRIGWAAVFVVAALVFAGIIAPFDSIAFFFVPGLVLFLVWWMPSYFARMAWSKSPFWTSPQTWRLTEAALMCVAAGTETYTLWPAIVRTRETPDFFLFFSSSRAAHFIPKRVLSAEQMTQVRDITARRAGKEGGPAVSVTHRSPPVVDAAFMIDAKEAARAGVVAANKTGSMWVSYGIIVLVVAWNTVPPMYSQWRRGGLTAISLPQLLLGLTPLAIVLFAPPLAARWAAARYARTAPSAQGTQHVGVAEWGLQISGPFYSGALEWASLMRADETTEFFLFFLAKLQPVFIPKRVLSPDDVARVRRLVHDGLGAKAKLLSA